MEQTNQVIKIPVDDWIYLKAIRTSLKFLIKKNNTDERYLGTLKTAINKEQNIFDKIVSRYTYAA